MLVLEKSYLFLCGEWNLGGGEEGERLLQSLEQKGLSSYLSIPKKKKKCIELLLRTRTQQFVLGNLRVFNVLKALPLVRTAGRVRSHEDDKMGDAVEEVCPFKQGVMLWRSLNDQEQAVMEQPPERRATQYRKEQVDGH